jgi:hypothetical protein
MTERCGNCDEHHGPILPALDTKDWAHVFAYLDGASRETVAEVLALREGFNDGPDWLCYGRLRDGRYFFVKAGCDYTGWG